MLTNFLLRTKDYYNRLSKMKNLYFVDDRISNKELINGCFATA